MSKDIPTLALRQQTDRVEFNKAGIRWLEAHVKEKPDVEKSFVQGCALSMGNHASSLPGHKEAQALLNTALREFLPQIIDVALLNAQNGNEEARAVIKQLTEDL